ncbi:MAG: hypothetical protein J0I09_10570 [Sphingobacteriia bacterium]|nr:hypothetical protein [Sphingobacteriia bacterium]
MKKKIGFTVLITLIVLSFFFVARLQYRIFTVSTNQKDNTNKFPELNYTSIDGKKIDISFFKKLPKFKLIVIFNSDCDHCKYQITELLKNSEKLNRLFIFFISAEPVSTLKQFGEKINISYFKNILMLNLDFISLTKTFDCSITPMLYLYNVDNILVRQYKGETPLDVILKDIN